MVFRQQRSSLAGLALTEDCGIYHLKVSVIGGEQCPAYFYLHILNRTVTDKDPARYAARKSLGLKVCSHFFLIFIAHEEDLVQFIYTKPTVC